MAPVGITVLLLTLNRLVVRLPTMDNAGVTFPKDFQEDSTCTEDGYPIYRRRENPHNLPYRPCIRKKDVALDNRWVVPYNRVLTQR